MSQKILILKGLPGSGKSTYARQLVDKHLNQWKRINNDSLRDMLDNSKWSGPNEKFIGKVRDVLILEALAAGKDVIVDNCNVNPIHEARIRELVTKYGKPVDIEVLFFDVPVTECIERDLKRPISVGEKVIRSMYNQHLRPEIPVIAPIDGVTSAIICDIDGTLALHVDRSPYDTEKCETDLVNTPIRHLVNTYVANGETLIVVSGRDELYRPHTERWLTNNGINWHLLFMRPRADRRNDNIVKQEIYEKFIRGQYNVRFVVDDRLRVVRMWHEQGLTVLRVGDPDADF